jgi:hypothetical protein
MGSAPLGWTVETGLSCFGAGTEETGHLSDGLRAVWLPSPNAGNERRLVPKRGISVSNEEKGANESTGARVIYALRCICA